MFTWNVKRWISVPGIVVLAGLAVEARAAADLSLGAQYRSYPLSGVVAGEGGYGILLYGAPHSPFAGYVRAAVEGYSAGRYNSGVAKIEIFPLAILGVRAGGESVQNDTDYSAYDCAAYRCLGRYYRTFVEAEMTLGAGPVFFKGRWRRERWTQADAEAGDFVDPTSGLLMNSSGEAQTVYTGMAGAKWNERWSTVVGLRYAAGDDGISQMPFGLMRWNSGVWEIAAGGGAFKSELKKREGMAMAYLSWEIFEGLGLK